MKTKILVVLLLAISFCFAGVRSERTLKPDTIITMKPETTIVNDTIVKTVKDSSFIVKVDTLKYKKPEVLKKATKK
jgi:hypothetical protein